MNKILVSVVILMSSLSENPVFGVVGPCGEPSSTTRPPALNGTNQAVLVVDLQSFPETWRDEVMPLLNSALVLWNSGCEEPPTKNDHPVFEATPAPYSTPPGTVGEKTVSVKFGSGVGPHEFCPPMSEFKCYPLATTQTFHDTGKIIVTLWEKSGREGAVVTNNYETMERLEWVFAHELGHVLGLKDDPGTCLGSIMVGNFETILQQDLGFVEPYHCSKLKQIHAPPDPASGARDYDPDQACQNLALYCDNSAGNLSPWPITRSRCTWFPDVTTIVETLSNWGDSGRQLITHLNLACYSVFGWLQGGPFGFEAISAPTVVIALPNDSAVASGSILHVAGWVWANTYPLRQLAFWIDGAAAQGVSITTGVYAPEMCQHGIDPGTCNPHGGFEGYIDVSYLPPGKHYLQVFATDQNPDPNPNFAEVEFIVPSSAPNQAPIAVNDLATVSIGLGTTRPKAVEVVSNDHDPEGWPLRLSQAPFVTQPTKGNVRRLDDRTIEYTPLPNASGTDTFQYKVDDSFGVAATATVTIQIMEGIFPHN
jgi:hypothetical protein